MTDLIMVLSRPDWIDFTNPKNQVVTRFIYDKSPENQEMYQKFFHQLLLSLELELRIQSTQHSKAAKDRLLRQIPPTIQWNLALARRWRDYVRVQDWGVSPEDSKLSSREERFYIVCASMNRMLTLAANSSAQVQVEETPGQGDQAVRADDEVAQSAGNAG
jgi:hypothetical protein